MKNEYYFADAIHVGLSTWEKFAVERSKIIAGTMELSDSKYQPISGYGWKDIFTFNPTSSEAIYIDEKGNVYKGVWFIMGDTRIVVFKR